MKRLMEEDEEEEDSPLLQLVKNALRRGVYSLVQKGNEDRMHKYLIQWTNEVVMMMTICIDKRPLRSSDNFTITESTIEQLKKNDLRCIGSQNHYKWITCRTECYDIDFSQYKYNNTFQQCVKTYWILKLINLTNDGGWIDIIKTHLFNLINIEKFYNNLFFTYTHVVL